MQANNHHHHHHYHSHKPLRLPLQQPSQAYTPGAFPLAPTPYPPLINHAGSHARPFMHRFDIEDQHQPSKPASRFSFYFWACTFAGVFVLGCFVMFGAIVAEGATGHMGPDTKHWVDEKIKRPIKENLVTVILVSGFGGLAVAGSILVLCCRRFRK